MKTYLCPQAIAIPVHQPALLRRVLITLLASLLAFFTASADNNNNIPELVWKNATLVSGVAGQDGAVYRFSQVSNDVDALVTIKQRSSSLVSLVSIDLTNTGWDKAWQPQISYNNGNTGAAAEWWMEFEINFVNRNTTNSTTVNQFILSAIDIDGNGDKIHEFVSMYDLKTYTLELNSMLTVSNLFETLAGLLTLDGKRFDGPTDNYANIDTGGTKVMTTATFQNRNSFRIRAGGVATAANGASDRMYSFYFKNFSYQSPNNFTLPLVLLNFNTTVNSKKVNVSWVTGKEKELSHFVIERSSNGVNYQEVAMVFANGNSDVKQSYGYTDALNTDSKGVLYYRLKMVDVDGRFQYSEVKLIRIGDQQQEVKVSVYPNPVVNEVRVTVPASWQNTSVTIDVFNINGQMVKHAAVNRSGQTETVNMNGLVSGMYVVKVSNGTETASQRIVKK